MAEPEAAQTEGAQTEAAQTDAARTGSGRSDYPRLELGHLSEHKTEGSTHIYVYDLHSLSVPRPRHGSTKTTAVCGTCGQEFPYAVYSRTALFGKRLLSSSVGLIFALPGVVLGTLVWHFADESGSEPKDAVAFILVPVLGIVALFLAFMAGALVIEGLGRPCAELRRTDRSHVLRPTGSSVVVETPSEPVEINADVGGFGNC